MTSLLRGTVVVSSPGAPPVRATAPGGGRVLVAPGVQGPPGHGVNLAGAVATYADLPELTVSDAGKAFMLQSDGRLYVWSGVSWPAEGAGAQFRGETGVPGRGIEVVSVDGDDLVLAMSDGSTVRASVPALAAAVAARDVAVAARADAVSARSAAESARDGAAAAASRAEGAADGVAADAAAAVDAAGRAEVAAGDAASGAEAAGVSAGDAAASATSAGVSATAAAGDAATASGARDVAVSAADTAAGSATAAAADADRAVLAAAGVDQVVSDAAGVLAGEIADDVARSETARDGAVAAKDAALGAAGQVSVDAAAARAAAVAAGSARDAAVAAEVGVAEDAAAAVDAAGRANASEAAAAASAVAASSSAGEAGTARDAAVAARDAAVGAMADKADLVDGVVPSSQIPAVAMTRPHVVATVAGLLALDVQEGDVGIIPDGPDRGSYMLGTGPATEIGSWKHLVTPEAPVSSVNGQTGTVTLGAGDVGAATVGDVAAVTGRVSALESSRPTLAEMQARPAMWLWDGQGTWTAPAGAVATDSVLNLATGEIHSIQEVA